MSSLSFLTRDGEASASGREYLKFGVLLKDLAWQHVARDFNTDEAGRPSLLRDVVDLPDWVTEKTGEAFGKAAQTCLYVDGWKMPVSLPTRANVAHVFDVSLNSLVANSSDPVALAVRLYGQAERSAWIDGPDRAWLADLIDQGRSTAYPPHAPTGTHLDGDPLFSCTDFANSQYGGWAAVVDLLRADNTSPVVLSYSVTSGFPDPILSAWPGDPGARFRRWWDQATALQQFDTSARGLRRFTTDGCPMLRISPDNLHTTGFGITNAPTWLHVAAAWHNPGRTRP